MGTYSLDIRTYLNLQRTMNDDFAFSLQIEANNLLYETRNWTKRIRHGKLPRLSIFVETNQASCFFCPTKSQETDGWGKKTLQRLAVDLKNEYPERKGFSVRNMQCMMQFYNEYNKELTMVKVGNIPITQSMIAQLGNAPIELPIKRFVIYRSLLVYPTMN